MLDEMTNRLGEFGAVIIAGGGDVLITTGGYNRSECFPLYWCTISVYHELAGVMRVTWNPVVGEAGTLPNVPPEFGFEISCTYDELPAVLMMLVREIARRRLNPALSDEIVAWYETAHVISAVVFDKSLFDEQVYETADEDGPEWEQRLGKALKTRIGRRYGDRNLHIAREFDNHAKGSTWVVRSAGSAGSSGSVSKPSRVGKQNSCDAGAHAHICARDAVIAENTPAKPRTPRSDHDTDADFDAIERLAIQTDGATAPNAA
jgi:hypothetical protein